MKRHPSVCQKKSGRVLKIYIVPMMDIIVNRIAVKIVNLKESWIDEVYCCRDK